MTSILFLLLLQAAVVPPRTAMINPALTSPVPKNLKKDYDKFWNRFQAGKDDTGLFRDLEKEVKKNPSFASAIVLQGYLDWIHDRMADADQKFNRVLTLESNDRIALSYLAERAFDQKDYLAAVNLYARLEQADPARTDVETKRQKALIVGTDSFLREAAAAERGNRIADAEAAYRKALLLAPGEPSLYARLGNLLLKERKWAEALADLEKERDLSGASEDIQRQIAEALTGLGRTAEARRLLDSLEKPAGRSGAVGSRNMQLEDLGRWGNEIGEFRQIQSSPSITREQLALLIVRYFPQIADLRPTARGVVVTDIQNLSTLMEIQTILGLGLMEPYANHTFRPAIALNRGELATIVARLGKVLGVSVPSNNSGPAVPADVNPGNSRYLDIQFVFATGTMSVDSNGSFDVNEPATGGNAVHAVQRLLELVQGKPGAGRR